MQRIPQEQKGYRNRALKSDNRTPKSVERRWLEENTTKRLEQTKCCRWKPRPTFPIARAARRRWGATRARHQRWIFEQHDRERRGHAID